MKKSRKSVSHDELLARLPAAEREAIAVRAAELGGT